MEERISKYAKFNKMLLMGILIIGAILRLTKLDIYPAGVHVDEAFAGYEAYSILQNGVDSWGYHNPVYFISWGSGMNVLESYLMLPFVAVLGLSEWAIRLPQAIMSIISIYIFYKILKKVKDEKLGIIGAFVMAICPWHYMLSRWGLESNLCLSMILLASWFFILAKEGFESKEDAKNSKKSFYLILSAFFFGLDLYCYAATWIHIAVIICIWGGVMIFYAFKNKNAEGKKYKLTSLIISVLLLALMALPLLLFILVNLGMIPEIRSFISVPRMVEFRSDEIFNLSVLYSRIHDLVYIIICQNDTQIWNAYLPYGTFYIFSLPVILLGAWRVILEFIKEVKNKHLSYSFMLLTYTLLSGIFVILQGVSLIRANYFMLTFIFYWAIGLYYLTTIFKALPGHILIVIYIISFALFLKSYFGDFHERLGIRQVDGSREAIEEALIMLNDEAAYEKICFTEELRHSRVLFYTKWPQADYMKTVSWQNYPDKYLSAKSFGPFVWDNIYEAYNTKALKDNYIYIAAFDEKDIFESEGYKLKQCGYVWLCYK